MDETAWGSDWYFWEQNWTRGQVGPYRVQPLNQTHCCPLKRWAQTHSLFKLSSWLHLRKKKTLLRSFPTVQDVVQRTSLARLRHVELCFPQMYKSSCRQWEDLCPAPSAPVCSDCSSNQKECCRCSLWVNNLSQTLLGCLLIVFFPWSDYTTSTCCCRMITFLQLCLICQIFQAESELFYLDQRFVAKTSFDKVLHGI